jgi:predicted RNA-binding protein
MVAYLSCLISPPSGISRSQHSALHIAHGAYSGSPRAVRLTLHADSDRLRAVKTSWFALKVACMSKHTYWLDLFTGTTWQEFMEAGANVSGFRASRWATVKRMKPSDYLLCYLTGVSRFIGVLEVTSEPYQDDRPIWQDEDFPCRVNTQVVVVLEPETAVPIGHLKDQLSIFHNLTSPRAWTGRLRGSPARWKDTDGEIILKALLDAQAHPVSRPVDPKKLARRPRALRTTIGTVTVPETENGEPSPSQQPSMLEPTEHTEMQFLLLKLGSEMGFDVWVARNDRSRVYDGVPFSDRFHVKAELPLQFDEATTKTIEYIDVLWLKGNAIIAAFEVESTTSIYSGLLRMSDLIAMQPNLNIPLYLVAPDERRDKVFLEVNRPTFSRLSPPLAEVCQFIAFTTLRQRLQEIAPYVRYMKPDFLEELAETCQVEDV